MPRSLIFCFVFKTHFYLNGLFSLITNKSHIAILKIILFDPNLEAQDNMDIGLSVSV